MRKSFVIEAVMIAVYGELLVPNEPVEYFIPYSTIRELYELKDSKEPIMPDSSDDAHVRTIIVQLIELLEEPLNRKKIEKALGVPWAKSPPMPLNDAVTLTMVNSYDNEEYGEAFDPIETELILTAIREKTPILTDQIEFIEKVIEAAIPVQVYDLDDFDFAVEEGFV
ncbi:ADP-heptose synthase [Paenibacillus sp. NPDC056579]|uniref:ADP-heptose synthase n=1 Tax=unclassified Paenibacillus TaxID=185978 RepID=UPI001EF88599|nr:ADP-heptose synthase [Paenibacillus sp. H1-7]ULL18519.1 ADP-heptose synthase [Paenibacillus sp. H1-7]